METTVCRNSDSDLQPFIEQKDVVLCRSGIQIYSYEEVLGGLGEPPVKKDYYRERRSPSVIVKALELCRSLPVTREHPEEWVNPSNWKDLAGGVLDKEVTVVALDGEAEGEIGLKSNITFYTAELYNYYTKNKEVSLGYTCRKHFVENPEEAGYDIEVDEITEVNHLAITRAGRGGSEVAVIDSILGGIRPMRTGIFAFLLGKKQKDSASSFGNIVLEAVKDSKGMTEDELKSDMSGVLDSMSVLKDCEAKDTLRDVVKDCFDNKDKALANSALLVSTLDSMYCQISGDSLIEISDAFKSLVNRTEPARILDSKDKEEAEAEGDKDEPETEKEEKEETGEKDSGTGSEDEKKDKAGSCNKDSIASREDLIVAMRDSLKPMVEEAMKDILGIKDIKEAGANGITLDSVATDPTRDYSSFLE